MTGDPVHEEYLQSLTRERFRPVPEAIVPPGGWDGPTREWLRMQAWLEAQRDEVEVAGRTPDESVFVLRQARRWNDDPTKARRTG